LASGPSRCSTKMGRAMLVTLPGSEDQAIEELDLPGHCPPTAPSSQPGRPIAQLGRARRHPATASALLACDRRVHSAGCPVRYVGGPDASPTSRWVKCTLTVRLPDGRELSREAVRSYSVMPGGSEEDRVKGATRAPSRVPAPSSASTSTCTATTPRGRPRSTAYRPRTIRGASVLETSQAHSLPERIVRWSAEASRAAFNPLDGG
jgi:hypothetical protein